MKYSHHDHPTHSLATLQAGNTKIVKAVIAIDTHTKKTATTQATDILYSDMVRAGCTGLTREEFLDALSRLGAHLSVQTTAGVTEITVRSRTDVFRNVLRLLEKMLAKPTFAAQELRRAKVVAHNTLEEMKENERAASVRTLQTALYGAGTRHSSVKIDSLIAAAKKVNAADLRQKHTAVLTRPWTCTIVGNKAAITDFNSFLQRTKQTASEHTDRRATATPAKQKLFLEHIAGKQNIDFSIGGVLPLTVSDPDYAAVRLALSVLGRPGFAGRLMSTVREKEGLTYSCYALPAGFHRAEYGYWRVWTFFNPAAATQGLTSVFREISKLHQSGIAAAELKQFKLFFRTDEALRKDSILTQFEYLHGLHKQGLTLADATQLQSHIQALTVKEVNAAIKKYLDPKQLIISGAGPTKGVQKELQRFIKSMS